MQCNAANNWILRLAAGMIIAVGASAAQAVELVKQPGSLGSYMENTPVIYGGQQLIALNHRDDSKNGTPDYNESMYLTIHKLDTGEEVARLGEGYSFVSAYVNGSEFNVFASQGSDYDWFHSIYRFWSTDLVTWQSSLAIPLADGEHLFNTSVCQDDHGYVMAYESNLPTQFCFKFARSTDLANWQKLDVPTFAGPSGNEYSACPVIRYNSADDYYYVMYLVQGVGEYAGKYVENMARSKDLTTWEYSAANPILAPGPDEGISTSDVDLFEVGGKTYLFYCVGNQADWGELRQAVYDGPMSEFFVSYFPVETPEPGTFYLLAVGITCLFARAARKRRRSAAACDGEISP